MKKYYFLVMLITLYFNNALYSQTTKKTLYQYKGTAYNKGINYTDNPVVTFDRKITLAREYSGPGLSFPKLNADDVLNNSLKYVQQRIDPQNHITYTISDVPVGETHLNYIKFKIDDGYNSDIVSFNVNYNGMESSVDISNGFRTQPNSFPINRSTLPSAVSK